MLYSFYEKEKSSFLFRKQFNLIPLFNSYSIKQINLKLSYFYFIKTKIIVIRNTFFYKKNKQFFILTLSKNLSQFFDKAKKFFLFFFIYSKSIFVQWLKILKDKNKDKEIKLNK